MGNDAQRARTLAFALSAVVLSSVLAVAAVFALDCALHRRFESAAGLNVRGYRGPVLGRKQPAERRIVVLGGSTAFGYGVGPSESFPACLERMLCESMQGRCPVRVANLAYNNEGAYSFRPTLEDYRGLGYDVAILYEGYNDLDKRPNRRIYRRSSPIFQLTGYLPILPVVLHEKMLLLKTGGSLEAAYQETPTVFKPSLGQRAAAAGIEGALAVNASLERQLGRLTDRPLPPPSATDGCGEPWVFYCQGIASAIDYALSRRAAVIVVTQPYVSDRHRQQQQATRAMLRQRFGAEPRVRYVDLGADVVDLKNPSICYDGVHLTARGNEQIARRLVEPVRLSLAGN